MSIPSIARTTIQRNATTQSFTRGESYYQAEAVAALTQRGNMLQAEVEGTELMPYQVTVQFESGDITTARCTCSYSLEGWCKHIVATLLACVHQPETVETRPSLEQLLVGVASPWRIDSTSTKLNKYSANSSPSILI
jgi:uncharacterized Zn finger protein